MSEIHVETIQMAKGPMDLPEYVCKMCGGRWYMSVDVVALIVSYSYEKPPGGQ
jgi:hypothetical protein